MSSLQIRELNKFYDKVSILKDINISIESGDFLVLVGPSGCGKSTLLNMIAGLEAMTSGDVFVENNLVNDLPPAQRDIAMVFQSYALYPNMNVEQNMAFGMEMRGVGKEQRKNTVTKVAKVLQIEHLLKRKPAQLSGGQRQRVAMGRALVREPKIFLFDEPLSNLDAKLRVEMRSEIRHLHKRMKSTIVYVTHDQVEALSMATIIVVLNAGVVQQQGSPFEIYNNPTNTFVASFMGSPPMNLIPAKIIDANIAEIESSLGKPIAVPIQLKEKVDKGSNIILGIRPEHLSNSGKGISSAKKIGFISELELAELTGADTYGKTSISGRQVNFRLEAEKKYKVDDQINLCCDLDKLYWFDAENGNRLL